MNSRAMNYLMALPPRTLILVMAGIVAFMLLESWVLLLRQPFHEYVKLQRDRAALSAPGQSPRPLAADIENAEKELAGLGARMIGATPQLANDAMIVRVIDGLAEIAMRHRTTLNGLRPAGVRRVAMFDEMAFVVQATADYRSCVQWMEEIERSLGPLAVTQVSIKRTANNGELDIEMRLAAFRLATPDGVAK